MLLRLGLQYREAATTITTSCVSCFWQRLVDGLTYFFRLWKNPDDEALLDRFTVAFVVNMLLA